MNKIASPPPSPLPELPTELMEPFMKALNDQQRRQFYKVLRALFNTLLPVKAFNRFGGFLTGYWYVYNIRLKYDLSDAQMRILTLLDYYTKHGKRYTCYEEIAPHLSNYWQFNNHLTDLNAKGFIKRSRINPNGLEYRQSRGANGKFINLTPPALQLITSLTHDLHQLIYETHIKPFKDDFSGAH